VNGVVQIIPQPPRMSTTLPSNSDVVICDASNGYSEDDIDGDVPIAFNELDTHLDDDDDVSSLSEPSMKEACEVVSSGKRVSIKESSDVLEATEPSPTSPDHLV